MMALLNIGENMFDKVVDLVLDCIFMLMVLIMSVLGTVVLGF